MPENLVEEILASVNLHKSIRQEAPHVIINANRVLSSRVVDGLEIEPEELPDGVKAKLRVRQGVKIKQPVHLCFGMLPERGIQKILLEVEIEDEAGVSFMAHCTFPNAVDVQHLMEAEIRVGRRATYSYFERHWHSEEGMVRVVPVARIKLAEGARLFHRV